MHCKLLENISAYKKYWVNFAIDRYSSSETVPLEIRDHLDFFNEMIHFSFLCSSKLFSSTFCVYGMLELRLYQSSSAKRIITSALKSHQQPRGQEIFCLRHGGGEGGGGVSFCQVTNANK